jgi:hypothetical protein
MVGLLWMNDQPVAKPLPTQDNTTYKHKGQTSMPSAGFEPTIPATKCPQTYTLNRAATEVGPQYLIPSPFLYAAVTFYSSAQFCLPPSYTNPLYSLVYVTFLKHTVFCAVIFELYSQIQPDVHYSRYFNILLLSAVTM